MDENLRWTIEIVAGIALLVVGYIAGYQDGDYPRRRAIRKRGGRRWRN